MSALADPPSRFIASARSMPVVLSNLLKRSGRSARSGPSKAEEELYTTMNTSSFAPVVAAIVLLADLS